MILYAVSPSKPQMKIIILLCLLNLSNGQAFKSFQFSRIFLNPVSNNISNDTEAQILSNDEILGRWKHSEKASRELLIKVLKKFLPSAFEIATSLNISSTCVAALTEYFKGLFELKYWAYAMLDSSGRFFNGIIGGKFSSLGDFDNCIATEGPNFKGKYCVLSFSLPLPKRRIWQPMDKIIPIFADIIDPSYLFGTLAERSSYNYMVTSRTAYCLPSACNKDEVEMISKKVMETVNIGYDVNVAFCEEKEDMPYTSGEISIIVLLFSLLFLITTGTLIDIYYRMKSHMRETKKQGIVLKLAQCFSFYTNTSRIFTNEFNPESISVFHGIRVISMLWIISSHTYFIRNLKAFDGLYFNKDIPTELKFQPISNGFLAVDSFFFISAVLLIYVCLRLKAKMSMKSIFILRYFRLTVPLMLMIALCSIAGHFGSGPFWREMIIDDLSKNCKNNGWFAMTYLTNYFFSKNMCMDWTWYLSADMQLFVIGLYIFHLLKKSSKKGFTAIGFFFLLGISCSALSHIYYKVPPTYLKSFANVDDWFYYGTTGYTPFHFHLPVYCVGMCVGYILATEKIKIPRHVNMMGWTTAAIVGLYLAYGTYYWNQGNIPGLFISTLYGSTFRSLWAFCLAFITISCKTGHGGIITDFLSWNAFVPLSRLTYMGYLVHCIILNFYIATSRSTMTYNHRSMLFLYCSVVGFTFLSSFLLSLLFESPFSALSNLIVKNPKTEKTIQFVNGKERKVGSTHLI